MNICYWCNRFIIIGIFIFKVYFVGQTVCTNSISIELRIAIILKYYCTIFIFKLVFQCSIIAFREHCIYCFII
ncbi:unknown [Candidatus Colimorpha enterica]|uniref:Uncharacterized protein n=1 Tax=Candidatus Colimorpha enterica TaxID=3083063 RepID=R6TSZ1_9BACT|nr:unknown [Candidatus Colimorpha enterica]